MRESVRGPAGPRARHLRGPQEQARPVQVSVKVLKLLDIGIEVDAQDKPDELPGNQWGTGWT